MKIERISMHSNSFLFTVTCFIALFSVLILPEITESRPEPRPMPYAVPTKKSSPKKPVAKKELEVNPKFKHGDEGSFVFRKSTLLKPSEKKDWIKQSMKDEFDHRQIVKPHEFCDPVEKSKKNTVTKDSLRKKWPYKIYLLRAEEIEKTLERVKRKKMWPTSCLKEKIIKLSAKLTEIQTFPGSRKYEFCSNLEDNYGITAGIGGFTTSYGDALLVLKRYKYISGSLSMEKYEEVLDFLKRTSNASDSNIPYFCCAWSYFSKNDENFRLAQENVLDALVFVPAMKLSEKVAELIKAEKLPPLLLALIYDINFEFGQDEGTF
ncbi:hypothetical protein HMI54_011124 [Coelomomyces lativittatus]|nr:hypothetical protein HMI54_011124 [Coelomomyces lativittatus]